MRSRSGQGALFAKPFGEKSRDGCRVGGDVEGTAVGVRCLARSTVRLSSHIGVRVGMWMLARSRITPGRPDSCSRSEGTDGELIALIAIRPWRPDGKPAAWPA